MYYLNQIYCLLFSYIQFTFKHTSECFLSNGNKNMHILGSEPELQAVRFGYIFRRKLKKVGGSCKRFKAMNLYQLSSDFSCILSAIFFKSENVVKPILKNCIMGHKSTEIVPPACILRIWVNLVQHLGTFGILTISIP